MDLLILPFKLKNKLNKLKKKWMVQKSMEEELESILQKEDQEDSMIDQLFLKKMRKMIESLYQIQFSLEELTSVLPKKHLLNYFLKLEKS